VFLSAKCEVDSGQFLFFSIRASAIDLIVIVSNDNRVVVSELTLMRPKHLNYRNLIHFTYYMLSACRLLSLLFRGSRTWTRSGVQNRKETSKSRLPKLRRKGPKEVSLRGHFEREGI
jgi:hypothetical protein